VLFIFPTFAQNKGMKIIFLLILSTSLFAQDAEMLGYLNQYRISNGKDTFIWSNNLSKISTDQNQTIIKQDSLSHSHKETEIAVMGKSLPIHSDRFICFLKNQFKIDHVDSSKLIKCCKLYIIYLFDSSTKHKQILLGDYKYIGFDVVIKDIEFKQETISLGGKTISFKPTCKVDFYSVMNLKKKNN
jgi:hypothetical protein